MKCVRNVVILLVVLLFLQGCKDDGISKERKLYYGPELYNASFIHVGNETRHIIRVMSRKDLSTYTGVRINSTGGAYNYQFTIEDGEFELKEYHLYYLCLSISDVEFEGDQIDIESIELLFEDDNADTLYLDKCKLVKGEENLNQDYVHINGCPLTMPSGMNTLPLELSAEKKVTVTNVYLTNDEMRLTLFPNEEGERVSKFCEFVVPAAGNIITWIPIMEVGSGKSDTEGIDAYKSYGTSIVVEYSFDGRTYYCIPGVNSTIYNAFGTTAESIETYFEYLGI